MMIQTLRDRNLGNICCFWSTPFSKTNVFGEEIKRQGLDIMYSYFLTGDIITNI